MARFSEAVPPGGEGWIILKVNTSGYRGSVTKGARVYSDDPTNRILTLTLKINVQEAIRVSRNKIYLRGAEGDSLSESVDIEAMTDRPLDLKPTFFGLNKKAGYHIEEIQEGRRFSVTLTNIEGVTGTHSGKLRIRTNYPERSELIIYIYMKIDKAQDTQEGD